MARKTNKQRAQELIDEVKRLYDEAKTEQEKKAWPKIALSKMKIAVKLDPENPEAWFLKGIANSALDNHQDAIADYTKASELNPTEVNLWINRAMVKKELGDLQGAIKDFTKAIEIDPTNATLWNGRGLVKNLSGDHQGAIADYTKAIELDPKNAGAWGNRGLVKFRLGYYDDAIKDIDEALGLDPTKIQFQQLRQGIEIAKLRAESGEFEQQRIKESRRRLKFELHTLQFSLFFYRVARIVLFAFLFDLIIAYWSGRFVIFSYLPNLPNLHDLATTLNEIFRSEPTSFSDFLFIVSRVSTLSIIIFPVVWGIRLLNLGIERAETLKWDIFSRANTENSIGYYQRELGNKRNDFIISYMKDWMNNNPADRLVALRRKKSAANEKPKNETLLQEIKNLLERLTKSNTKED